MTDAMSPRSPASAAPATDLLAELRSGDPARRDKAVVELRRLMVAHAEGKFGSQSRRVDLDPESLANSVLRAVDAEAAACRNNDQFVARLKIALTHRAFDRKKRKGRDHAALGVDDDSFVDVPDPHPGPIAEVDRHEDLLVDEERLGAFLSVVADAAKDSRVRDLIEFYVVRGLGWSEIAQVLGAGESALKVALSRARGPVLEALFEPLRAEIPPAAWVIAETLLIRRHAVDETCEELHLDREDLERALDESILPAFHTHYGGYAVEMLPRLAGFTRR